MQKLGKRAILTFTATFDEYTSVFKIEGSKYAYIPSAMLRRNFPQAKTNTRLKIQFYPWEVDVGRTIWFYKNGADEVYYTFSRRGKVIKSVMPVDLQKFLKTNLGVGNYETKKLKIAVTAI